MIERAITGLGLALVLATATLLYFGGLQGSTLSSYDEGEYASEADRFLGVSKAITRIRELRRELRGSDVKRLTPEQQGEVQGIARQGIDVNYAKPLHPMLIAAAFLALGRHDWVALWVSAAFALATVALVFIWGRELGDRRTGLVAAALLSTSGLFSIFARMALAEPQSALFMTAALVLVARGLRDPGPGRSLAAGLCFGIGIVIGYRPIVALPFIAVMELSVASGLTGAPAGEATLRRALVRLGLFGAAALLPALVMETIYHGLLMISARYGVFLVNKTYLEALVERLLGEIGRAITVNRTPFQCTRLMLHYENPAFLILSAAGILTSLANPRQAAWAGLGLCALGWFAGWDLVSFQHHIHLIVPILPVLALLAGRSTRALFDRVPEHTRDWTCLILVLILLAWGRHHALAVRPPVSGYRDLVAHMGASGIRRVVTTQPRVLGFHLGQDNVRSRVRTPGELEAAYRAGFTHYQVCFERFFTGIDLVGEEAVSRVEAYCRERTVPVVLEDPYGAHDLIWQDHNQLGADPARRPTAGEIRIYDLGQVFPGAFAR